MKKKLFTILFGLFCLVGAQAQDNQDVIIKVAIMSVNDFHGGFVRDERKEIPGAGNLLFVIDSLKGVYPYNIVVAAGDNFGGSYFSNITKGSLIPTLFNKAGTRTSALGNHEFDNGQKFLAEKWEGSRPDGWDITYVCANVKEDKTGYTPAWAVPMESYTLDCSQNIPIRVNFVGLIAESAPKQTAADNVKGLTFDGDYVKLLEEMSNYISPSDINILLTHIGTEMNDSVITWTEGENNTKQQIQNNTSYHGILSAHSHKKVCGLKNNMPIVQGEISGKYVGLLEIDYSCLNRKVIRVTPKLISTYKKDWQDTDMDKMVNQVVKDNNLDAVIVGAEEDLIHSRYDSEKFTALGSYVCSAFAEKYREVARETVDTPILSFFGFGSIRTNLLKGNVTKLDAGEVLPFAEDLVAYRVKGKDIKNFIEYGINNKSKGWIQMNNLDVGCKMDENSDWLQVTYVRYRIKNKGRRVIIQDSDEYIVTSVDFLLSGGDGYPNLKNVGRKIEIDLKGSTNAFFEFLSKIKEKSDSLYEDNPYKAEIEVKK